MPKAEDAARESFEPEKPPATSSRPPLEWTGRGPATGQPEPQTEAAPVDRPDPEARAPLPGADHRDAVPLRGTRGLAGWIAFGLGVAAALIAAAIYLRPDPVVPAAEPAADPVPATLDEAGEADPVAPDAATQPGIIRLRVGPDANPVEIARITEALETEGLGPIRVETLPFAITQSRVGYYRPEDEAAARTLAELAGPLIGTDSGEIGLRDYGDLLEDTDPGRLDLWLAE